MLHKLKNSKRANFAPIMTVAYIFFNVLLFIIISAVGMDGYSIGKSAGTSINIDGNVSSGEDVSITKATGWLSGFTTTLYNLPWWVNILFVMLEVTVLTVIILAWVRGL